MLNKELIVKIIDVDNNGNGIARTNNIVVFIKGALKDEVVKIKIIEIKKKYMIGSIIEIISASDKRVNVTCPYYDKCGGCVFLHTTLENEKDIKSNFIKNLFKEENINIIDIDYEYNYRNKVTLHIKNGKLGLYEDSSNNLVEINNCLLLDNRINEVIEKLRTCDLSNLDEIVLRSTYYTKEVMIIINGLLNDKDVKDMLKLNITSLYFKDKLVYGKPYITEIINNIKYTIYPKAFFQVNTRGMLLLYEKIKEYIGSGNTLLDLYSGTGTIGIYLKDNFKEVTGIEINKSAVLNANLNKQINNIDNIKFICNDSSIENKTYDSLVVDPPRSGLSNKVIFNILNGNYNRVVYVSCNPLTLKRDLEYLKEKYIIKEISMLNMFVKSKHMECVVLLTRK